MINTEALKRLEFDRVLEKAAQYAHCDASRQGVLEIRPLSGREEMEESFALVQEIRTLTRLGIALKLSPFADLTRQLKGVRPRGAVLSPLELQLFIPTLRVMAAIALQLSFRTDVPRLKARGGVITGFPDILNPLEHTVNAEGEILDSASRLLAELRGKKKTLTTRTQRRLEEIVRERHTAIFLQDDFITQRSGRWVIPVRMDSKGMVPGVVHDVSNSGETAFMEPLEIISLANELENLAADERAEEIRVVREICNWIREDAEAIQDQLGALIRLDIFNCIALLSDLLKSEAPILADTPQLSLKAARHPILTLMGKIVVPLDLELDPQRRVMVITGPNTGGKTIALKSAGLLCLMALCGMPIPAAEGSQLPLIEEILVDIGDEQSIEESLSTFSAHISKISSILNAAKGRSLVLLDELGTGTEPGQGAALACAVLSELKEKGAQVIATTHLTQIIGFVQRDPGMVNAAMAFDRERLTPLFRLKQGEPGESHALEIARRYGLPERVVLHAREMLGTMEADFHALLAELKEKNQRVDETLSELSRREEELLKSEARSEARLSQAEAQLKGAREQGLIEVKEIIQRAKREMAAILEEARQARGRQAKDLLEHCEVQVEQEAAELRPEEPLAEIVPGQLLFVKPLNCDARVVSVDARQEKARVRAGSMELEVPLSALAKPKGKEPRVRQKRVPEEERPEPAVELNLIGLRVEEALERLEPFLDRAARDRVAELRIVHGKGTGALMKGVRTHLDGHPLVASFRTGERYEGGDGVTMVTLR